MEQARCTIRVHGLDCPTEAAPLRAALEGAAGVGELGFDLALGHLTVEYDAARIHPAGIVRLIADRAKMRAEIVESRLVVVEPPAVWGRWAPTVASGLALAVGMVIGWVHGPASASRGAYGLAIVAGLVILGPKAIRSLMRRALDIHVLMSLAILGALALGEWDEGATVAFLFGLSEAIEALSLERARWAVRSLLEIAPESAERVEPDGSTRAIPASGVIVGDRVRVRAGTRGSADRRPRRLGPFDRGPEGDHGRVGSRGSRSRRPGLRGVGER